MVALIFLVKKKDLKMNTLYSQVILCAEDYINAQDVEPKSKVTLRYKLLLKLVAEYNETCHSCNNRAPLVFDGEPCEAFSLTHGKLIGRW